MNKFLRLVIVAFAGFLSTASAFTTIQPATTSMRSASVAAPVAPAVQTTTSLPVAVDPAIAEMMSKSNPVGAIILGLLAVAVWELVTPGRAKKET